MSSGDSFVDLKEGLEQQDSRSETELWQRYAGELTRLARRYLGGRRADGDSEDAVVSAMNSFFQWLRKNPGRINDADHLQALLAKFIFRKCRRHVRQRAALKNQPAGSVLSLDARPDGPCQIAANDALPINELDVKETLDELLRGLSDQQLRIFELDLGGSNPKAISGELKCSVRTVQRTLAWLRRELERQLTQPVGRDLSG